MRSTSNKNVTGSSEDRRRRRAYLVEHYRADVDGGWAIKRGGERVLVPMPLGTAEPVCRCYRCGCLLTVDTVTVDRRIPGCQGGTYRRENIRPACGPCNFSTGGVLGASRRTANRRRTTTHRKKESA